MGEVTGLRVVDVIPSSDSAETFDNSEPSIAVDPLDTNEIVAGAFGVFSGGVISPYFTSIDGGTTWRPYGDISHDDKSLAWSQDGSTLFTTSLREVSSGNAEINTYSGTISGSDFGSPINTYNPSRDLDQPWIRTGPSDHVYVAYNDITSAGDTARVLVSSNGGVDYTSAALDRLSGSILQDAPAVRVAVNGATVYGAFTRWTSELDQNTSGTEVRYNADVYVVRSDDGGADGFDALGSGGLGVKGAWPVGWDADETDGSLTLGRNRTGSPLTIAVDPNDAGHVVIAYGDAPGTSGTIDEGKLGLVVTESFDSGTSWTQKFATPVTSGGIKSSIPSVAIAADGMIAMLYLTYDPSTNELSQQLLTTNAQLATADTITLQTEKTDAAPFDIDPYLGDFYDLTCVGNTFFGIFSAANKDNGTDASFPTVTFQRAFTGTAGSAGFQLLTSSNGGSPVSASVDPFFFSFTAAVTVSSGTTIVSSPTNESYIVVDSGTLAVASGGTALQEIIISSGGSVLVDAGGTVLDTVISNGGMLQVSSGGVADPTTIFSGGSEIVSGGGTDLGALISGGVQDVFGLASGATVFSGGLELVESGATASATTVSSGGELEVLSGGSAIGASVKAGGTLALGSGTSLTRVTGLRIVDVIPLSNSAETFDNSEPSIAVDPLNKNQLVAGAFGVFTSGPTVDNSPFFISVDGGTAWSPYGELDHNDKSLAWSTDGSTLFAATMVQLTSTTSEINTYSGTISGSDFGSPIDTYDPSHDLDQPWIATGSGGHVFISYNDFSLNPNAHVLVSSDGGVDYTPEALDRLSGSIIQDAPAVRLAVNGATVYGAFTRWNSVLDFDANQTRYNADLYVVRSDDAGADGFDALGSGGLGVNVALPTGWYANTSNKSLTLGQERTGTGTELAIAVDPTDADHVVIAYGTAPGVSGTIGDGQLGLVITESIDGGASWTQKFATPVTSGGIKSSIPAVAIAADGMIAMLYCSYDPSIEELSQHLLTTSDDFASTSDFTLATEKNDAAPFDINPYLGDFFNLVSIGNTFYGIFSAANADNGTDASFATVTFQRAFTGTAGPADFQLLTSSGGSPVSASIDPFFFSFTAVITVSSGTTVVSSPTNESYIVLGSGTLEVASGGTVSGQVIVSSGGSVLVDSSGTTLDTLISSGGSATVSSGGKATDTTVSSGGTLAVLSGGTADPTTISSGGSEIVSGGGTDLGALISGGVQDVFGLASGATVFTGSQVVESGGTASNTTVSSGGTGEVVSAGTALDTILNGGTEF